MPTPQLPPLALVVTMVLGCCRRRYMSPANCCKGAFLFHRFKGLEQSVCTDIKTIKDSDLIPADIPVHGYVYEVRCRMKPILTAAAIWVC